jgi:hypothetical protein
VDWANERNHWASESDNKNAKGLDGSDATWNFGLGSHGQGKNMLLFLRKTSDSLDQASERMVMLDDLAVTFAVSNERQKSEDGSLFALTIAVVMLPSQFLAGIFGMNFEHGMALLKWEHGYLVFWLLSGAAVLILVFLALLATRCRRSIRHCCRRKAVKKALLTSSASML